MTSLLRSLDLLVTSRYHACVLSMAAAVPQVAVGHDLRLKSIYADLGLEEFFIPADDPDRDAALRERIARLLAAPDLVKEKLRRGYRWQLANAQRNPELLQAFVWTHDRSVINGKHDFSHRCHWLFGQPGRPTTAH